ncbi:MAG: hypothetical protein KA180_06215 [Gemmatimonadales bacterium]|nr:hypothetical protein [Gemmatimonadales bacterium]
MTLLEVVVGLTITGVAVSAGYAALATALDHRDRAEAALTAGLEAANIRRELRAWLGGARLTVEEDGPGIRGLDGVVEVGQSGLVSDDRLTLLTTAATPLEATEVIVTLFVDRDSLTPATGLVAHLKAWRGREETVVEVDPRVTGLAIRYFSEPLGHRGWLPSWISRSLLPSGIEVTLTGDSLPPLLVLPMLVAVGSNR